MISMKIQFNKSRIAKELLILAATVLIGSLILFPVIFYLQTGSFLIYYEYLFYHTGPRFGPYFGLPSFDTETYLIIFLVPYLIVLLLRHFRLIIKTPKAIISLAKKNKQKIVKHTPDALILVGVLLYTYNHYFPVEEFGELNYHNNTLSHLGYDYTHEISFLAVVLTIIGGYLMIKKYLRKN